MPVAFAKLQRALSHVRRTIRAAWRNHLLRRRRQRDFAALVAMDDMSLRDMGLSRLDVRGAIRSGADLMSGRR